ncbi:MAG: S9 family peptidase [Planctomycetes bacterium]|nr:S9 family peptidase [Planctomycetota bacterium]
MRGLKITILSVVCLSFFGCEATSGRSAKQMSQPPKAKAVPYELAKHGHVRIDNYYWLKDRENQEVIDYLEAENEYTAAMTAHTEKFQKALFKEIKGRIKQTDESVPYKKDGYFYYTRYEDGQQYPFYCRKKGLLEAAEEVMLDANKLAKGHKFMSVRGRQVSADNQILAYAVDTRGRRVYTIHFKNLETGEVLADTIPKVTGNMAWANDNRTLFYSKQDPETLRSYQIFRHVLGAAPSADSLVYEEKDDTFATYVFKTKSKKYVMITSRQTLSNEYRFVDADNPTSEFTILQPRERNLEYSVDHYEDKFYIRTNWQAKNFRLMATPVTATTKKNWTEVIPHRDDVLLGSVTIFKDQLVVSERQGGLVHLRVIPWSGGQEHYLEFGEPAYLAYATHNHEFDTPILRYSYTSMTTPNSVFDYNMVTREKTLLKQDEVLGGFSSDDYETDRLHATARDGTKIPISIVYRKGTKRNGNNPLLLYGYGSYGASMDATFRSSRLSLIDRGFIYAIAHVRGGQELGRQWYEDGKLFHKKNTFTDFIDCGKFLVAQNYTNPDKMFAMGGSAGGLLMGAVLNMAPDLFHGVVARVPFVDVITTMLDDSIPLTTSEYDEWGDPNKKDYYDYILSYSPYDNVQAKAYPHLLVTTGLHDSQVQYWEPAKWVAKLRAVKTDNNDVLLKTNMAAGHGGASGRDKRYEETAYYYAFLLDHAGINK